MITNETLKNLTEATDFAFVPEMAKELLERREKDPKPKPKSMKSPMSDEDLEDGLKDYAVYRVSNIQAVFRELLEYRRLTRRTHYQEGDFITNGAASQALVATRCQQIVGWDMHNQRDCCLIPLSNFAHLHND
jgi:16S rRNA C967 or C1407 C5-methylase (RsmB/RsmF family)